jgi:hypothetical protein
LQKQFVWNEAVTALLKKAWEMKSRVRYADKVSNIKKKGKMPAFMDQDVWDGWTGQWQGESSKKKSEQTSKNRFGQSGQPSKHTGGSVSYPTHRERLVSIVLTNIFIIQYMYDFLKYLYNDVFLGFSSSTRANTY